MRHSVDYCHLAVMVSLCAAQGEACGGGAGRRLLVLRRRLHCMVVGHCCKILIFRLLLLLLFRDQRRLHVYTGASIYTGECEGTMDSDYECTFCHCKRYPPHVRARALTPTLDRFEPYVSSALAQIAGPAAADSWLGRALLPATVTYITVKVV